jgi:membrane protein YqaA with SNARE-associated domain
MFSDDVSVSLPGSIGVESTRPSYRNAAIVAVVSALAVAGGLAAAFPEWRSLIWYGLYAIPAHMLISVLANEPMLLAAAKTSPPILVAIAGTAGCMVALVLDYALIGWLVNHHLIRGEIEDSRGFHRAQRFFGRAPFLLIAGSALLPVPFYPAKILAIARNYSLVRCMAAVAAGRLPRFYLFALGGQKVQAPDSALVSAGVALGLIGLWGLWRTYRRNRAKTDPGSRFSR